MFFLVLFKKVLTGFKKSLKYALADRVKLSEVL